MTLAAKHLALFSSNLSGGGAERTLTRLATHWVDQGREVTLVTLAKPSPDDFDVSPSVRRIGLGLMSESGSLAGAVRGNLHRIAMLRETFRAVAPDVVVSFIEQANVLALLAARPLRIPVVISERTDPARHRVGRLWNWLRRRTYPRCIALVVLTEDIAKAMRPVAGGRPVIVIPNGVAAPVTPRAAQPDNTVIGVGRLAPEKGFDRLIEAFAGVADRHPQWRLVILGEGPQRNELQEQVTKHKLIERIAMPGHIAAPSAQYAKARLFALSSRYEGFPNGLLEAMAHGVSAVAFDGPAAVRQVVRHGIDGLLVPDGDVGGLSEALDELISDDDRRQQMGEAARDVVNRFSLDNFFARWDAVIEAGAAGDFSQLSRTVSE